MKTINRTAIEGPFCIVQIVEGEVSDQVTAALVLQRYGVPCSYLVTNKAFMVPVGILSAAEAELPDSVIIARQFVYVMPAVAGKSKAVCNYCSQLWEEGHECSVDALKRRIDGIEAHMSMWHSEARRLAETFNVSTFYHTKKANQVNTRKRK